MECCSSFMPPRVSSLRAKWQNNERDRKEMSQEKGHTPRIPARQRNLAKLHLEGSVTVASLGHAAGEIRPRRSVYAIYAYIRVGSMGRLIFQSHGVYGMGDQQRLKDPIGYPSSVPL